MAFNVSAQSAKVLDVIGTAASLDYGVVALSGGTIDVKTKFSVVEVAIAQSQTSNAARVSATAGGTITISGTGSDVAMWIAIGRGGR